MADAFTLIDRGKDLSQPLDRLSPDERLKKSSNYLRGTIATGLLDRITGAVAADDTRLMKIHGMYQQDDRDLRDERRRQKLEPAYLFMIRVRLPGGVCTSAQWLKLDALARAHGGEQLRLTTRQTFQFHWVLKEDVRATIQGLHEALLDTVAACGDVSRNVMCAADPDDSALHAEVVEAARTVSDEYLPRTRAYHEIWYGEEKVASSDEEEQEPFYGATYLPRKFKIGFVVPPSNDIDVYTQDLGFIAIDGPDGLEGYNVCIGGGMGRTENEPLTYPRLGDVIGFISKDRLVAVTGAVMSVQRDYGNRAERNRARFKYTIDDKGLAWIKAEIESHLGAPFEPARPFRFISNGDSFGWRETGIGHSNCTLYVESGRLANRPGRAWLDGLRAVAQVHRGTFRVTPNQNLIVAGVAAEDRPGIEALLAEHGLAGTPESAIRRNSIACVALPTCGLAMAEAERYLPDILTRIEAILDSHGLAGEPITLRISGCPNGCSRPYVAEIALTGRAPGKYNLYLGGGFHGERLARMVRENIGEAEILNVLEDLLGRYASERQPDERLGDYVERVSYLASEQQIPGRIDPII
jgi:sulfite reductase (NADPH) hemoprotein beta-component